MKEGGCTSLDSHVERSVVYLESCFPTGEEEIVDVKLILHRSTRGDLTEVLDIVGGVLDFEGD